MASTVLSGPGTTAARTMIVQRTPSAPLCLASRRRRDAVLARLLQSVLDPRLARGVPAESGRLIAARAAHLVDPRHRGSLADAWDGLVVRAAHTRSATDRRVPVARRAVCESTVEIAALTAALRSAAPVAACDVARAGALLTDGAGPVYTGTPALRAVVARLAHDLAPDLD